MSEFETDHIEGVVVLDIQSHDDTRGFFREILRAGNAGLERIAQVSHSRMHTGVVKAWHYHPNQIEGWYVARGVLRLVLHDLRPDSRTHARTEEFLLGDDQPARLVCLPPGIAHGCKCIAGPADLIYLESLTYDPAENIKMPHDDARFGYDWSR